MVHRNVHSFKRDPVYNITINRWNQQRQNRCECNSSRSIWKDPMALITMMDMFSGFTMNLANVWGGGRGSRQITQPQVPTDTTKSDPTLENLQSLYGNTYNITYNDSTKKYMLVNKNDITKPPIEGATLAEISGKISNAKTTPTAVIPQTPSGQESVTPTQTPTVQQQATNPTTVEEQTPTQTTTGTEERASSKTETDTQTQNEDADKYGYSKETTEQSYTVVAGNSAYSIAVAKYDIPPGISPVDVAHELAAINSGIEDLDQARNTSRKYGIVLKPGDTIKLPTKLTINGVKIPLKSNHAEQTPDASNRDYSSRSKYRAVKYQQINDKYYITKNGVADRTKCYNTEAEVKAEVEKLNANQEET